MLQASFRGGGGGRYQFNVIPNRSLTPIFFDDFDVDRSSLPRKDKSVRKVCGMMTSS